MLIVHLSGPLIVEFGSPHLSSTYKSQSWKAYDKIQLLKGDSNRNDKYVLTERAL